MFNRRITLEYLIVVFLFKAFSLLPKSCYVYRLLSRILGPLIRQHRGLPDDYIRRSDKLLDTVKRYNLIGNASRILEIGSGWVLWESAVLWLFYGIKGLTLFDIYDNRQPAAFKKYFYDFEKISRSTLDEVVRGRFEQIKNINSFSELDSLLGLKFVIDREGSLRSLDNESFDLILSVNVLEHVRYDKLPGFIADTFRILRPGGYCVHQIDIGDHFADHFRKGISRKNYLQFSDFIWQLFFENRIKYFNRVQRPEWLSIFEKAGFSKIEEEVISCRLGGIKITEKYHHLSRQDLECRFLRLVCRKGRAV